MSEFDVIIVGGGPAGSCAGRFLTENGVSCLLLDKQTFPRRKVCAGGMTHRAIAEFPFLKPYIEAESYLGHLHGKSSTIEIRVKSDNDPLVHYSCREILDAGLLAEARKAGVEVKEGTRVTQVEESDDRVVVTCGDGGHYEGKVLIGADGIQSVVRRGTALNKYWRKEDLCVVYETEAACDKETIRQYYTDELITHVFMLYKEIRGYAWVFPKKSHINLGLGIFWEEYDSEKTKALFEQFVEESRRTGILPDIEIPEAKSWLLHMGGPLERFTTKRTLLIGDAAAFVNPLSGEGIYFAVLGAKLASNQLSRFFRDELSLETALEQYEQNCFERFGDEFRTLTKYQKRYGHLLDLPVQICRRDPVFADIVSEFSSGRKSFQQVRRAAIRRFLLGMLTLKFR